MSGLLFTLFAHAMVLLSSTDTPNTIQECAPPKIYPGKRPYTVLVEGNVGAGKSTLVNILAGMEPRIQAVPEPVEAWQNVSGNDLYHSTVKQIPDYQSCDTLKSTILIFRDSLDTRIGSSKVSEKVY